VTKAPRGEVGTRMGRVCCPAGSIQREWSL
jgi:hypothetical protein